MRIGDDVQVAAEGHHHAVGPVDTDATGQPKPRLIVQDRHGGYVADEELFRGPEELEVTAIEEGAHQRVRPLLLSPEEEAVVVLRLGRCVQTVDAGIDPVDPSQEEPGLSHHMLAEHLGALPELVSDRPAYRLPSSLMDDWRLLAAHGVERQHVLDDFHQVRLVQDRTVVSGSQSSREGRHASTCRRSASPSRSGTPTTSWPASSSTTPRCLRMYGQSCRSSRCGPSWRKAADRTRRHHPRGPSRRTPYEHPPVG